MNIQLQPEFDDILQSLGRSAAEFFLAASLYPYHYTQLDKYPLS